MHYAIAVFGDGISTNMFCIKHLRNTPYQGTEGKFGGMEKTPNFVNNMADCIEIAMFGLVNHQNYPI